jgi:hypothetical protein
MTVMLLALLFSDAALASNEATESRDAHESASVEHRAGRQSRDNDWTPRVREWTIEKPDCSAFFQREIEGFGLFRIRPRCAEDGLPHAL